MSFSHWHWNSSSIVQATAACYTGFGWDKNAEFCSVCWRLFDDHVQRISKLQVHSGQNCEGLTGFMIIVYNLFNIWHKEKMKKPCEIGINALKAKITSANDQVSTNIPKKFSLFSHSKLV